MRKTVLVVLMVFMAATALQAASWTGWITDEHCGAKGNNAEHKGCALKCAKDHNAALVFYNNADKKIYKLDKQDVAKAHIGSEVVVTGDADGDNIKVSSIEDSKPAAK
jgi:hypothetical protein